MGCKCEEFQQLEAQFSELNDTVDALVKASKFLTEGHPILLIEHADDRALFDFSTGKGVNAWEGWAVCDGKTHLNSSKKSIVTPNFTDRFIVQAGGQYQSGDTGGADEVALTVAQLAEHSHSGSNTHNHGVTDPGHNHGVTDPGHTHIQDPHDHVYGDVSANQAGQYLSPIPDGNQAVNTDQARTSDVATATNQSATTGITVNSNTTGATVDNETIDVQIENTGENEAHENRPPYYAAFYVMRIG